jgi:hypothetical protein
MWNLDEHAPLFVRAGYRQLTDLLHLTEKDIRALGVIKDAEIRRAVALVGRLRQEDRRMSLEMDALFIDPDTQVCRAWLAYLSPPHSSGATPPVSWALPPTSHPHTAHTRPSTLLPTLTRSPSLEMDTLFIDPDTQV